jgi:hypothetical protein
MGQEKMTDAIAQTPDQITVGIDISKDRLDAHLNRPGSAGGSNSQIGWSHDESDDKQILS